MTIHSSSPTALWGDGFDSDGLRELSALSDWRLCSPDEMIRVFPNLLRTSTPVPLQILDRVRACVTALAETQAGNPYSPKSVATGPQGAESLGLKLKRWWTHKRRQPIERDRDALALIDRIAVELASGDVRPFDAATASEFVYRTGVHPVYVWPEALLTHELFTAIGWIGHAERTRRALMTADIAAYFSSTLALNEDGTFRCVEPLLLPYIASPKTARSIVASAEGRLAGRRPIARLRAARPGGHPVFAGA